MNMIMMKMISDHAKSVSRRGGGKHYYVGNQEREPSEEEILYKTYKELIEGALALSADGDQVISFVDTKKRTASEVIKRKKREEKTTNIYISDGNKDGLSIDDVDMDLTSFSAVGKIGENEFFAYNKETKTLILFTVERIHFYGPHQDYYSYIKLNNEDQLDASVPIEKDNKFQVDDYILVRASTLEENGQSKQISGKRESDKVSFNGFISLFKHILAKEREFNKQNEEQYQP